MTNTIREDLIKTQKHQILNGLLREFRKGKSARAGCLRKRSHKEPLLYLKNVCIYFCHLWRRQLIHCSVMLTEQFLSRFIDGVVRARLVIHNDCHSLNLPEILRVNMQSWKGFSARDTSVGVTSLYSCQACQADCLPFPTKAEVVSQPLSA